jgi:hypothetical protein
LRGGFQKLNLSPVYGNYLKKKSYFHNRILKNELSFILEDITENKLENIF